MELSWAWEEDLVWVRALRPVPCLLPPVGDWDGVEWGSRLRAHFGPRDETFCSIPSELALRWHRALPGAILREEERGEWDYLHRAEDLKILRGNTFMKKRNKISEFLRDAGQSLEVFPLAPEHLDEVWRFQERWLRSQEDPRGTLAAEHRAIREVFEAWGHLPTVRGTAIRVRGEIAAYAVEPC